MPRISALTSLTTADNGDELPIVDVSASVTKKITRGDLLKAPLPTNSVTTLAISDASVTATKIDLTTLPAALPSWTNVTYQNSWVDYSAAYVGAQYFKDLQGFVHIHGMVKGGTSGSAIIFTLPVGFRPSKNEIFPGHTSAGAAGIEILSTGTVAFQYGTTSTTWSSFGEIIFRP